jgi:hypothetical protein
MCLINSAQLAYLEQSDISTVRNLSCRKYFFQKLNQFSQRNNVLDAVASNIDGIFEVIYVFLQLC